MKYSHFRKVKYLLHKSILLFLKKRSCELRASWKNTNKIIGIFCLPNYFYPLAYLNISGTSLKMGGLEGGGGQSLLFILVSLRHKYVFLIKIKDIFTNTIIQNFHVVMSYWLVQNYLGFTPHSPPKDSEFLFLLSK